MNVRGKRLFASKKVGTYNWYNKKLYFIMLRVITQSSHSKFLSLFPQGCSHLQHILSKDWVQSLIVVSGFEGQDPRRDSPVTGQIKVASPQRPWRYTEQRIALVFYLHTVQGTLRSSSCVWLSCVSDVVRWVLVTRCSLGCSGITD